jgi:hypothetical protein
MDSFIVRRDVVLAIARPSPLALSVSTDAPAMLLHPRRMNEPIGEALHQHATRRVHAHRSHEGERQSADRAGHALSERCVTDRPRLSALEQAVDVNVAGDVGRLVEHAVRMFFQVDVIPAQATQFGRTEA